MRKLQALLLSVLFVISALYIPSVSSMGAEIGFADKDGYSSIYDIDDAWLAMGTFSTATGGTYNSSLDSVTGTNKCIVSTYPIFLPYGASFIYDYDTTKYGKNLDFRVYECDEQGKNNTEITATTLAPANTQFQADSDYKANNFVVTNKGGIWINIRIVPWANTYTQDDVNNFVSYFKIYDLTKINAPIFDNSTIEQCWENTAPYEAWAFQSIIYNESNNLYYFVYSPQTDHTVYDGLWGYRTSSDLKSWSDIHYCVTENTIQESLNGANYCSNGDILVSAMVLENTTKSYSYFYRSDDGGNNWQRQDFVLDGVNVSNSTIGGRLQRVSKISDGTLLSCYYFSTDSEHYKSKQTGICYSKDNGKTWHSTGYISEIPYTSGSYDNSEYSFVKLRNGNVVCFERSTDGLYFSISEDGGMTFGHETKYDGYLKDNMSKTPFEPRYDEETDSLEIYFVDRYKTGGLCGIFISGDNMSSYLLQDSEFKGISTRLASLGINGNNDQGYPEIVMLADGSVKCFFYQKAIDGESKSSFYCIEGKIKHFSKYQVRENVVEPSCTSQGECDVVTYCTDCNKELKREHIILDKVSHSFDKSIAPATFNSTGFTINSCKNCGYTYINNYKQQIGTVALSKYKYTYNGKAYKPVVSVKDINGNSITSKNYTVAYSDTRKNVGKYKVTVKFKGEYSGSKNLYFTIVPKGTNLTKVSSNKNGFELKWKMQKDSVTGYQVQYSTSKTLKNAKTLNVGKNSITTKKITGLKNKKRYYVRIRTFKIVNGTRYYSSWSGTKSVLTK